MTYFNDAASAKAESPFRTFDICMCCGQVADGPLVGYDFVLPGAPQAYTRALLHRDCAFAMAQRLILDTWPHRHVGEHMKNNR